MTPDQTQSALPFIIANKAWIEAPECLLTINSSLNHQNKELSHLNILNTIPLPSCDEEVHPIIISDRFRIEDTITPHIMSQPSNLQNKNTKPKSKKSPQSEKAIAKHFSPIHKKFKPKVSQKSKLLNRAKTFVPINPGDLYPIFSIPNPPHTPEV